MPFTKNLLLLAIPRIYSLPYHKGIRLDTGENGARVYENVIWNAAKGATFKGGVLEGNQV